jgi:phage gp16-like protein
MNATDPTRRSRLAATSLLAKQINMDEEALRHLCKEVTGKASRKDMTLTELTAVRDRLVAAGAKLTKSGGGRALAQEREAKKLRALWLRGAELGIIRDSSESALCSWASNNRDGTVTALLQSFTPKEWPATIERLKKWLAREIGAGHLECEESHRLPLLATAVQAVIWGKPLYCPDCGREDRAQLLRWVPAAPKASRRSA